MTVRLIISHALFLSCYITDLIVCRGRKRWTTVVDATSRSRYWRSTRLFDGFHGSVHSIIIHGLYHFSGRKHDSSHHLGCRTQLLRKYVRLTSHVPRLVIKSAKTYSQRNHFIKLKLFVKLYSVFLLLLLSQGTFFKIQFYLSSSSVSQFSSIKCFCLLV